MAKILAKPKPRNRGVTYTSEGFNPRGMVEEMNVCIGTSALPPAINYRLANVALVTSGLDVNLSSLSGPNPATAG